MSSWQASVLNTILSYVARPSLSRGKAKVPLSQMRQTLIALDKRWQSLPSSINVTSIALDNAQLLHYQQAVAAPFKGSLFYIRGGGFCFKTPNAHARMFSDISARCGLDMYVPDYRLAPEFPFPAPLDDVIAAYQALLALKGASDNIILMGDSAGGNLALSLLLAADDPFFTLESLLRFRGAYLAGFNPMSAQVSPLYGELENLPPMLVIAGTRELLLQDSERLVARVSACGGEITSAFYANMPHVFPLFNLLPEALEARAKISHFIHAQLIR